MQRYLTSRNSSTVFRAPVDWADATFLHAAKGRDLASGFWRVDADDAAFEPLGDRQMRPMSRL
jgi:hypothetical protein